MQDAILKLNDFGELQNIYNKWFESNSLSCQLKERRVNSLDFHNTGGVFLIVGLVLVLSILITFIEFTFKTIRRSNDKNEFFFKFKNGLVNIKQNFFSKEFKNTFYDCAKINLNFKNDTIFDNTDKQTVLVTNRIE